MTYIRIDDQITDHPKIASAGPAAAWMFVCALCYASRHLTDGFIPKGVLTQICNVPSPRKSMSTLVTVGLVDERPGGWQIRSWSEYQRTSAEIADIQRKRAAAGSKGGTTRSAKRQANPVATARQTASKPPSTPEAKDPPESRVQSTELPNSSTMEPSMPDNGSADAPPEEEPRTKPHPDPTTTAHQAARIAAQRQLATQLAAGNTINNHQAWIDAVTRDLTPRLQPIAEAEPTWPPHQIADGATDPEGDLTRIRQRQHRDTQLAAHLTQLAANRTNRATPDETRHATARIRTQLATQHTPDQPQPDTPDQDLF